MENRRFGRYYVSSMTHVECSAHRGWHSLFRKCFAWHSQQCILIMHFFGEASKIIWPGVGPFHQCGRHRTSCLPDSRHNLLSRCNAERKSIMSTPTALLRSRVHYPQNSEKLRRAALTQFGRCTNDPATGTAIFDARDAAPSCVTLVNRPTNLILCLVSLAYLSGLA